MRELIFLILILPSAMVYATPEPGRFIGKITGIVRDGETGQPLVGVNILMPALKRGTTTDTEGRYSFDNLHEGVYTLRFSYLGYATATFTVVIEDRDVELNVVLQPSILQLPSITVTGKPQATDILSSTQSTDVLEEHEIARLRGQTIGGTLDHLPGVSVLSTGTGVAKPVIRGLSSQRVLIINDGVRQEGQQWADEHGPEIDVFQAEKIEVVRGPGSILYGSDALGGVVNVVYPDLHVAPPGRSKLESVVSVNAFSNNDQLSGALGLSGAIGRFGYRGNISMRDAGDIRTPRGILFNSGSEELNGSGTIGYTGESGFFNATYTRFSTKLRFHEDPILDPGATPYQQITHDKLNFHSNVSLEGLRLESHGGWQKNVRQEFEEDIAADPALELVTSTYTFDAKGHHRPFGPVFGTVGLSMMRQNFDSRRQEKLIPNSKALNLAAFLYEEFNLEPISFSGGIRFDSRSLDVEESAELNVQAQERSYTALSGSIGATYRPLESFAIIASYANGWRAPTAFELFADGVHEGTATYEVGLATLLPERSSNVDLSLRYVAPSLVAQMTVYRNRIIDYIYAAPTGLIDSASTFPIYQYRQADATLIGGELSLKAQLASWWQLHITADVVRGENNETKNPLPRIPAPKVYIETQFQLEALGPLHHPHLNVRIRSVGKQSRVDLQETPTAGYALFDLSAGFEFELASRMTAVHLGIDNLFDRAYVDHLNRYKSYALNPGRNLTARITMPLSLI
ncbi:MAG TPA: TonB-dependent receptor [Bacteroidota bacterium]|nr:TonB-dependent receptor [Bacteroidota bacterium]